MKSQQQAPWWVWLLVGGGVLGYLAWIVGPMVYCHYRGKETTAVVAAISTKTEGGLHPEDSPRRVRYYTLAFDGHRVEKKTSGKKREGDRLPVIYLPGKPESVVRGSRADGLWRTIQLSTNERNLGIAAAVGVFFLLCAHKARREAGRASRSAAP